MTIFIKNTRVSVDFFFQNINLQSCAKNTGKLRKLRKSCNRKRNINGIYNEKLNYSCLQQLPTLGL